MNILPKKRWHVRTKDNIARVRRDEAKAAEEEKERERRIHIAEQEARTSVLREQARLRHGADSTGTADAVIDARLPIAAPSCTDVVPRNKAADDASGHVNLFTEVADGQKSWGINKEHEEEKKQEQETYEKSIGLLTYLGQTSLENKEQPWYYKAPEDRHTAVANNKDELKTKNKLFLDPLKDMRAYMKMLGEKSTNSKAKSKSAKAPVNTSRPKMKLISKHKSSKTSKSHKHRKHKHSRRESSSSSSSFCKEDKESIDSKQQTLERLRAERLRREREESQKAERLLIKLQGGVEATANKLDSTASRSVPQSDGDQRYNSQFNPHLVRKRKP